MCNGEEDGWDRRVKRDWASERSGILGGLESGAMAVTTRRLGRKVVMVMIGESLADCVYTRILVEILRQSAQEKTFNISNV